MNILLAIHHLDLRLAIELLLREEPGFNVVGVVRDTEGLIALTQVTQPHLLLLDWELGDRPLVEVLAELYSPAHQPKLIVLGKDEEERQTALAAGANAFVIKGEPPQQLLTNLRMMIDSGV